MKKGLIIYFNLLMIMVFGLSFLGCSSREILRISMGNIGSLLNKEDTICIRNEPKSVYYYTNRELLENKIKIKFTSNRAKNNKSYHGVATVNIPFDREVGEIPQAKFYSLDKKDKGKYFLILSNNELNKKPFYEDIRKEISKEGGVMIFIHGFQNTFDESIFRTAQLVFDLNHHSHIIPIAFSWPSGPFVNYWTDEENVKYSIPFLKKLLLEVSLSYCLNNLTKSIRLATF